MNYCKIISTTLMVIQQFNIQKSKAD